VHVVQVSFFVDPERRSPSRLLEDWFSLSTIAEAVASTGVQVTVIQASMVTERIEQSGVRYHFVAPDREGKLLTKSATFPTLLRELSPDVLHVHGLGFAREVIELASLASRTPIFLQDHADRVPRIWRRATWRRGAAAAAGISFCAQAQAEPFYRAGLLGREVQIFEIPESTSPFVPGNATAAREETGIYGDPAILFVSNLNQNKDPLTVLDGVGAAIVALPGLQLWCCYVSAPLLSSVKTRVANDPALRDRVHLLGLVPHDRMEQHMRASDLFVLGSRREGSSFSLIEALGTGLMPVVTDIPSLRALTAEGSVGELWECGNSTALTAALIRAASRPRSETRASVRAHFDATLSPSALGRRFAAAYASLLPSRQDSA